MARPIVAQNKKKRNVSLSLDPTLICILDNLCSVRNLHRSAMVAELIRITGWTDLGLGAIEEHIMPVRSQQYLGACNPKSKDGFCPHPMCKAIYEREDIR